MSHAEYLMLKLNKSYEEYHHYYMYWLDLQTFRFAANNKGYSVSEYFAEGAYYNSSRINVTKLLFLGSYAVPMRLYSGLLK